MHLRKLTGEHRIRTARPPPKSRQADALLKKKAVSRQAGLTELMKGLDAGYAQSYQRLRRKKIYLPLSKSERRSQRGKAGPFACGNTRLMFAVNATCTGP